MNRQEAREHNWKIFILRGIFVNVKKLKLSSNIEFHLLAGVNSALIELNAEPIEYLGLPIHGNIEWLKTGDTITITGATGDGNQYNGKHKYIKIK
jgi:hypothetical protein